MYTNRLTNNDILIKMEKTVTIIVGIIVIALCSYMGYTIHQSELRKKELDKKKSDCLDKEKEYLELIKYRAELSMPKTTPSANGKTKNKKVDVAKHN